jgi:hypothetical protein
VLDRFGSLTGAVFASALVEGRASWTAGRLLAPSGTAAIEMLDRSRPPRGEIEGSRRSTGQSSFASAWGVRLGRYRPVRFCRRGLMTVMGAGCMAGTGR